MPTKSIAKITKKSTINPRIVNINEPKGYYGKNLLSNLFLVLPTRLSSVFISVTKITIYYEIFEKLHTLLCFWKSKNNSN